MLRSAASSNENTIEPLIETGSMSSYAKYHLSESFTTSAVAGEITARATAETAIIAREIREGTLSGFVGSATAVTGRIAFKSLLRINGLLSGRITSIEGTLIVGAAGRVDANISVAVARIHGTVTGDIVCTECAELGPAAKVTGNIRAPRLVIDRGAVFDGSCRMTTPAAGAEAQAEQVTPTVAAPPQSVAAKAPRIARKGKVVGAKPKRTRTRAAMVKSQRGGQVDGEQVIAAAG